MSVLGQHSPGGQAHALSCTAPSTNLLASDECFEGTSSGLQCMILQSEFYINMDNLLVDRSASHESGSTIGTAWEDRC